MTFDDRLRSGVSDRDLASLRRVLALMTANVVASS
jgi:hypothetical protein